MEWFWHRQISRTSNWREANFEWPGLGAWLLVALTLPILAFQLSESARFWLLQMFDSFNPARWYTLKAIPWLLALAFGTALFLILRAGARMIVFAAVGAYAALFVVTTFRGSYAWGGTFDAIALEAASWRLPLYEGAIIGSVAGCLYNYWRGARSTPWRMKHLVFLVFGLWLLAASAFLESRFEPMDSLFAPSRHFALIGVAAFGTLLLIGTRDVDEEQA